MEQYLNKQRANEVVSSYEVPICCVSCNCTITIKICKAGDESDVPHYIDSICDSCAAILSDSFDPAEFDEFIEVIKVSTNNELEILLDGLTIDDVLTQDDPPKELYLMEDVDKMKSGEK